MKADTNSNSYTIIYASVMVVIVAFLLAFVSSSPKATQDKNAQLGTKKQILAASNIKDIEGADAEYQRYVESDMPTDVDSMLTENTGRFVTNYEKEVKEYQCLHVFICDVDGQVKYVVPIHGADLRGGTQGYVALNEDKDTIYSVYFSHASKAPGLGAEVAADWFRHEFASRKALENSAVTLDVVKNGKVEKADYQVDGTSGGTITSVGVDAMLKARLNNHISFLTK